MRLVALSNIDHSGVMYTEGEIIEDIEKQDGERLIKLGVAENIDDEDNIVDSEEKEEKKAPRKRKATDDKEESEA